MGKLRTESVLLALSEVQTHFHCRYMSAARWWGLNSTRDSRPQIQPDGEDLGRIVIPCIVMKNPLHMHKSPFNAHSIP